MQPPTPEPTQPLSPADDVPPQPRKPRRWLGALVALVALALVGAGSWYLTHRPPAEAGPGAGGQRGPGGPGGPGGARRPGAAAGAGPLVTVGQAVVKKTSVPVMLDALGTVTPVTTITVRPQVAGVMTDVLFTEGQMVKKGDVIARIDPRPYEQALMQAQGARVRDQAQLEAARVTLERFRTLLGQDSIARQEVDTQSALVKQLEGTVTTDRASEDTAKLNVEYTRVTSPISGRVGLRTVDPGNYVAAGATTGIAVITQITPIDVQFTVPQDRVPEIQSRVAQGAKLEVSALDRVRAKKLDTGVFSTLDNVVDTTTGTVKAKARFANAAGALFPNQFVNLQLVLRTIDDALVVPVTALRTSGSGNYVYVINEDRTVSMRNVTRGDSTVDNVVITKGLQEGEHVVTEGGDRLKDGSSVQLPTDAPRSGRRGAASAPQGAASAAEGGASAPAAAPRPLPTAEQRQRMLDSVKDDPEQLARRKQFLDALDKGDPAALERWQTMSERPRRRGAAQAPGQ